MATLGFGLIRIVNLPNLLSLSRVPALIVIAILLHLPPQAGGATWALILFVLAAFTDYLDGWVARKQGLVSDLGKFLDALTDKILTLGLFITFLSLGILPAWTLLLVLFILIRELLITGLRLVAAKNGLVLAAEKSGKIKTFFQMASLAILLLSQAFLVDFPGVLEPAVWRGLYGIGGLGSFCVAAALTIFSGVLYLAKYGRLLLDPEAAEAR